MQEIIVGSDYSGVGAFDQALDRLNIAFKKLFACDFDYWARLTYILNFGSENDLEIAKSKEHKMFCDGMEFVILSKSEQKQIDSFKKKCSYLDIAESDLEHMKFYFSIAADNFAKTFSFYYPFNVYDREIPKHSIDIYMTSPPCQAFSLAGKRLGKADIKGILFFNSLEFIQKNKPKNFIFENVKGLLSDDKTNKSAEFGNTFQEWINYLGGKSVNGVPTIFPYEDSVPYHIYFKVLNAKEYGVPQNRERIFIIGIRDDEENDFQFPKNFPLEKRLKDILEVFVDEKYFLSDEMVSKLIKENGKEFINQNTQASQVHDSSEVFPTLCAGTHGYASGYIKDEIIQINNPIHSNDRIYSEEGICPTLNTMQGGNRQPFVLLNRKKYNIYKQGDVSDTIIAGGTAGGSNLPLVSSKTKDIVNNKIRRLTPTECLRLMDFNPPMIEKTIASGLISDSQLYKQAGNSICVEPLKLLIKKILKI